jgi:hypothetical protein
VDPQSWVPCAFAQHRTWLSWRGSASPRDMRCAPPTSPKKLISRSGQTISGMNGKIATVKKEPCVRKTCNTCSYTALILQILVHVLPSLSIFQKENKIKGQIVQNIGTSFRSFTACTHSYKSIAKLT